MSNQFPKYCNNCHWFLRLTSSCGPPESFFISSLVSILPYIIIGYFIVKTFMKRQNRNVKISLLLITGYLVSDLIVKRAVGQMRPYGACKSDYGFPSSHMVVTSIYVSYMLPTSSLLQKILLLSFIMIQGYSRINLLYHTFTQVVAGTIFGSIYTIIFLIIYSQMEKYQYLQKIYRGLGIQNTEQLNGKNVITKKK